eukprot:m.33175 g.33175  ORF g.33175 m.33175 type:complete len:85 (+) comp6436_c3_seq3:826-1080(+)
MCMKRNEEIQSKSPSSPPKKKKMRKGYQFFTFKSTSTNKTQSSFQTQPLKIPFFLTITNSCQRQVCISTLLHDNCIIEAHEQPQ